MSMAFTNTREYGFEPQQETQMAAGASALRRKKEASPVTKYQFVAGKAFVLEAT